MAEKKTGGVGTTSGFNTDDLAALTKSAFAEADARVSSARSPGWFPNGVNHFRIEVSLTPPTRFVLEIDGPPTPAGRAKTSEGIITIQQLTPTASWWFRRETATAEPPFIKVISLASKVPAATLPQNWSANREHWGLHPDLGVGTTLSLEAILTATAFIHATKEHQSSGDPSPDLEKDAADFAANWRFQTKANGLLDTNDWTDCPPPMGDGKKFYYLGPEGTHPGLLLELTADEKDLRRITWIASQATAGYQGPLTFKKQPAVPSSWTGLVYYSVATGLG